MVRAGFLGAGFIARIHALRLESCREAYTITSVFDPVVHRRERFAEWQRCRAAGSVAEVLSDCDAVFVCTWTSEHPVLVDSALDAAVAVFCEKPLATDLPTAREMCSRVEAAGVVNQVGLVLRSEASLLAVRERVRAPGSGRIMNVVFRDDQFIPIQGMYRSDWRGDRERAGSGALLEHSIHDLDILEWLCGPMESVSAFTSNFHGLAGIEDSVSVAIRFVGGHSATLSSVWHDVGDRPSLRRMEVFCENALVVLDDEDHGDLQPTRDPPELSEDSFLRAVREGGPASPSFADALRAHVLVDAVYRSAAGGGVPVDVSP